jgi:Tfp pilus assembly protein PilF
VAIATEARETRGLVQLALEKMRRSRFAEARHDLEEVLRTEPEQPLATSYYGLCLANLGELKRGLLLCARALDREPVNVIFQVNFGKVQRLSGDNAGAHRSFRNAWSVNHRHPAPAAELARMGIRRRPVLPFLPRGSWCNRQLGKLRSRILRSSANRRLDRSTSDPIRQRH